MLAFKWDQEYFMSDTFRDKSRSNIVISKELKNDFLIYLFKVSIIIITSSLMIKVDVVNLKQHLTHAIQEDMS